MLAMSTTIIPVMDITITVTHVTSVMRCYSTNVVITTTVLITVIVKPLSTAVFVLETFVLWWW